MSQRWDIKCLSWCHTTLVCPIENERCCMARLLSNQADVKNQISLLEQMIIARSHLCMFLLKFHYELNPIEMVNYIFFITVSSYSNGLALLSIGGGLSTGIVKFTRRSSTTQKFTQNNVSTRVLWRSSGGSSTIHGGLWMCTGRVWPGGQQSGLFGNRKTTAPFHSTQWWT